jgi:phosphoribosylcarboxyaminoimidazole (NCAIR) mutase
METGGLAARAARVFFHGWKSSIAALVAGMAVSLLLFGFWMPYWRIADQDIALAYQGLLLNDGRAQEYFDHTGYLYDLVLAAWYWLLHGLGLLPVHALPELPPTSDVAAFDRAWQQLVEAGRVLSLILGAVFVWVYATLVRRLVGDWRIAIMAAIALAYSGGVAMHIRIMRTELLSAALVTCALLLVLVAAREPGVRRHVLIAVAGLCASLAIVTKVQALLPALAIPAVAPAFGQVDRVPGDGREPGAARRWAAAALATALALAVAWPAAALLRQGMAGAAIYRPLGGGLSGVYQWLIALWVVGAMAAYALAWRVPAAEALTAMTALAFGIGLGLLSLDIRYQPQNVIAVANPVEHMFAFAASGGSALVNEPQMLTGAFAAALAQGFVRALAMHSFVFSTSARPTLLLEWFAIGGAVVLWRRGERRLPLQAALLIVVAWALDAVFTLRGLQTAYFAYTDPLLILAAALVLAHLPDLQTRRWARNAALGLLVVYVVWAHIEPAKAVLRHNRPQEACVWLPGHVSRVVFPFCKS